MPTSSESSDITADDAGRYSASTLLPLRALTANNYYSLHGMALPQFDASCVDECWLVGTYFVEWDPSRTYALRKRAFSRHQVYTFELDQTLDLRRRVLSYRMERPHDSPLARAVNDALTFIDLVPATATLPYVALADDGEVNFYWRQGQSLLIDVGFVGDGMMHYYVWDEASGVDVDASIPFSGRSLPRDIVNSMPQWRG